MHDAVVAPFFHQSQHRVTIANIEFVNGGVLCECCDVCALDGRVVEIVELIHNIHAVPEPQAALDKM